MGQRRLGQYVLESLLGAGGMGEVHRAHDSVRNRTVALKVLPEAMGLDADFTARFRREQHVAAQLRDPHIIPIHDFGEVDGRLFIDMRLVDGRDVSQLLADGPLPPERAVHLVDHPVAAQYPEGFRSDGTLDHGAQVVWWAAAQRFTERDGDGCNPYTFIYGGVESDPACPVGQAKADWNVDFVKDAWQQAGCLPNDVVDDDLRTFRDEGDLVPVGASTVPAPGDAVLWTDPSGRTGAVGVVLEAQSASRVKVTVGDDDGSIVTRWVDPSAFTERGYPVTGYVTPTCG